MNTIIGRKAEIRSLEDHYSSGRPEFIIIYGRRRVGKTFLVKELFEDKFSFYFTGSIGVRNEINLTNFDKTIENYGGAAAGPSKNWYDAFSKLRSLLSIDKGVRKVVFLDEMPWLAAHKSGFLAAFDYFWNSWASSNPDIMLLGCGSATAWISRNIFQNRGGLHNRITGRIYLSPFTIGECEEFFKSRSFIITRYQLAECYMIFGGIPYYLDLFERNMSFSQNVDNLCFSSQALLKNEFNELFFSLFKNPNRHIDIVCALSAKHKGMTFQEISKHGNLQANGHLSLALMELEQSGFIENYNDFTRKKKDSYYYLKDPFTLFYLEFMRGNNSKDEYYWTNNIDEGKHRAWTGYAFEQLCRLHLQQIKRKLGIQGVSTSSAAWRSNGAVPGAQIDLVISRKDGVINLCEIKYTKHSFEIKKKYAEELEQKKAAFLMETHTRGAIHITMITTFGVARKGYFSVAQSEVTLDDLFS